MKENIEFVKIICHRRPNVNKVNYKGKSAILNELEDLYRVTVNGKYGNSKFRSRFYRIEPAAYCVDGSLASYYRSIKDNIYEEITANKTLDELSKYLSEQNANLLEWVNNKTK